MDRPTANASSSMPQFYWQECTVTSEDNVDLIQYTAGIVLLIVTNTIEVIVGSPLNIWLICHIVSKRFKAARMLPADFFPFHLALTQIVFYLYVPLAVANAYVWQSNVAMKIMVFLDSLSLVIKPLLLCLVCVERYIAVVRPLDYIRLKRPQYKWGCLALVWCIYFVLASRTLFSGQRYSIYAVFIPSFIIDTFCSRSILRSLRKPPPGDHNMVDKKKKAKEKRMARTEGGEKEETAEGKGEDRAHMKKRAFITVVIIQAMLTVNYMPFVFLLMVERVIPTQMFKCQLLGMCLSAATGLSYMQPLLYLHRLGRLPCSKAHRSATRK